MKDIDQKKIIQLENHLRENRDDVESWLVLGDLLQEKGDPKGEPSNK